MPDQTIHDQRQGERRSGNDRRSGEDRRDPHAKIVCLKDNVHRRVTGSRRTGQRRANTERRGSLG